MEKITFKEYLESKEKLRQAINESPVRTATYIVNKYCKLPIGNTKDDKQYVPLKPKNKIVVEWKYNDIDNPDLVEMRFEAVNVDSNESFSTFWASERFQRWLNKNTREEL
jgi:hypothetical protein